MGRAGVFVEDTLEAVAVDPVAGAGVVEDLVHAAGEHDRRPAHGIRPLHLFAGKRLVEAMVGHRPRPGLVVGVVAVLGQPDRLSAPVLVHQGIQLIEQLPGELGRAEPWIMVDVHRVARLQSPGREELLEVGHDLPFTQVADSRQHAAVRVRLSGRPGKGHRPAGVLLPAVALAPRQRVIGEQRLVEHLPPAHAAPVMGDRAGDVALKLRLVARGIGHPGAVPRITVGHLDALRRAGGPVARRERQEP